MSNLITNSQNKLYIINNNALELKNYIQFKDQEVRRVCAETWGDGFGITPEQAATVTNLNTYFRGNTNITSFDELSYFTRLTSIYGNNSIDNPGAFGNCTNLTSIAFPSSLTTIGQYAFYNCSKLQGSFDIPNITLSANAFRGCSKIQNLVAKTSNTNSIAGAGNGTGTVKLIGNVTLQSRGGGVSVPSPRFVHYIIQGNVTCQTSCYLFSNSYGKSVRISGNMTGTGYSLCYVSGTNNWEFLEIGGQVTSGNLFYQTNTLKSGGIIHFGYNGIAVPVSRITASSYLTTVMNRISKIYVGSGESQEADQAVLDQYLADTNWTQYSSKLDIWYNYINSADANPNYIN